MSIAFMQRRLCTPGWVGVSSFLLDGTRSIPPRSHLQVQGVSVEMRQHQDFVCAQDPTEAPPFKVLSRRIIPSVSGSPAAVYFLRKATEYESCSRKERLVSVATSNYQKQVDRANARQ